MASFVGASRFARRSATFAFAASTFAGSVLLSSKHSFCTTPKKMDAFVGKWNFVESDNFEAYLKQAGVGLMTRKIAGTVKPTITFEKDGSKWKMSSISTFKTIEVVFELDKQFEETTGDGRKCLSTFRLNDGKLVQEQKAAVAGEKDSHFDRWIEGSKLIITGECEGVKFRRVYERA